MISIYLNTTFYSLKIKVHISCELYYQLYKYLTSLGYNLLMKPTIASHGSHFPFHESGKYLREEFHF